MRRLPPTTVKPRSFVEMCQCFGVTCCISVMAERMPSFLCPGYSYCFHFVHTPVPIREHKNDTDDFLKRQQIIRSNELFTPSSIQWGTVILSFPFNVPIYYFSALFALFNTKELVSLIRSYY